MPTTLMSLVILPSPRAVGEQERAVTKPSELQLELGRKRLGRAKSLLQRGGGGTPPGESSTARTMSPVRT